MSNEVIAALIGAAASIIVVLITNKATASKLQNELRQQLTELRVEIKHMQKDIQDHNHYAKLFAESMPVVQEQIKVINHRVGDLERKIE